MKLELTTEEANLIVGALAEQPYKFTATLIAKIQSQWQEQNKEPPEEE